MSWVMQHPEISVAVAAAVFWFLKYLVGPKMTCIPCRWMSGPKRILRWTLWPDFHDWGVFDVSRIERMDGNDRMMSATTSTDVRCKRCGRAGDLYLKGFGLNKSLEYHMMEVAGNEMSLTIESTPDAVATVQVVKPSTTTKRRGD